ncbi:MAG TPA: flagellar motor switch protein FliM, partial [Spirochaetia bacterium]|nr:flagellar motor switch protein FliM [Spirochaetia bacterium]
MTEVLSQDEIDQLLTAISSGEVEPQEVQQAPDQKKIKIYDFKRPDKFSKDQIRTISIMHETFARLTTTSLSAQLRSLAQVHVASVDQLTYEEFIRSIPNPTTLAVINMDPLKGSAILEIDPAVTFAIIDRLFGGQGEGTKLSRDLTDIEQSVMENNIVRILGNLREAWSTVIDLRPRLGQIETNPQFAQIVPPTEMVVLVTLETKVGEVEGMMNFCIPYLTIEPIISKLSAQYWYSSVRRGATTENLNILRDRLSTIDVAVVAEIGTMSLTVRDVLNLKVGDVIRLADTRVGDPMILTVGNKK